MQPGKLERTLRCRRFSLTGWRPRAAARAPADRPRRVTCDREKSMAVGRGVTAFVGARRVAAGELSDVLRELEGRGHRDDVRIFDDQSGRMVEPGQAEPAGARRPGRPKLGVVAREITL